MGPVYFCSCSNCNCTATVLSINPRARAISTTDHNKNTTTYSFSTISILPADNSKYVWREETHMIRTLVEAADINTEVKDTVDMQVQTQLNLLEVIFILALAASTAVGKFTGNESRGSNIFSGQCDCLAAI